MAIPWKAFFVLGAGITLILISLKLFTFLRFVPVVIAVLSAIRFMVRSKYFWLLWFLNSPYRYSGGGGFGGGGGGGFGGFGGGSGGGGGAGGGF